MVGHRSTPLALRTDFCGSFVKPPDLYLGCFYTSSSILYTFPSGHETNSKFENKFIFE